MKVETFKHIQIISWHAVMIKREIGTFIQKIKSSMLMQRKI